MIVDYQEAVEFLRKKFPGNEDTIKYGFPPGMERKLP